MFGKGGLYNDPNSLHFYSIRLSKHLVLHGQRFHARRFHGRLFSPAKGKQRCDRTRVLCRRLWAMMQGVWSFVRKQNRRYVRVRVRVVNLAI